MSTQPIFVTCEKSQISTAMSCCSSCGSSDIDLLEATGETVCLSCGTILQQGKLVSSLEFVHSGSGGAQMTGQFVSQFSGRTGQVARELQMARGSTTIRRIADQLSITPFIIEGAERVYMMALQRNFTSGRKLAFVAVACLYTVCRREASPHMLVDFSDVLQVPVKILGRVFVNLLRLLHIRVPLVDPSLYMERFTNQLKSLGPDVRRVTDTSLKVLSRFNRDWMATGRRPMSLCGAALLISLRLHDHQAPTLSELANVVRCKPSTIAQRLHEFQSTSLAALPVEDFATTDLLSLPSEPLPPCARRRVKRQLALEGRQAAITDRRKRAKKAPKEAVPTLPKKAPVEETQTQAPDDSPNPPSSESMSNDSFVDPNAEPVELHPAKMVEHQGIDLIDEWLTSTDTRDDCYQEEEEEQIRRTLRADVLFEEDVTIELGPEETLGDVSDSEIDHLLLSPIERRAKTLMWNELMKDVLPQMYRRWNDQRKRRLSITPKRSSKVEKKEHVTSRDAVLEAFESKSILSVLNDSSLESLFAT